MQTLRNHTCNTDCYCASIDGKKLRKELQTKKKSGWAREIWNRSLSLAVYQAMVPRSHTYLAEPHTAQTPTSTEPATDRPAMACLLRPPRSAEHQHRHTRTDSCRQTASQTCRQTGTWQWRSNGIACVQRSMQQQRMTSLQCTCEISLCPQPVGSVQRLRLLHNHYY